MVAVEKIDLTPSFFAGPLCANVRETSSRSEISVEGEMDLQDEEISQGYDRG